MCSHERDELAVRRQVSEVCRVESEVSQDAADRRDFLMRYVQEIRQDSQLMHHLEG